MTKYAHQRIGWFRFEVTDSGVGISAAQRKAVFGEFSQFDRNELQGGGESMNEIK
jgi:signal transduction histidine kinase